MCKVSKGVLINSEGKQICSRASELQKNSYRYRYTFYHMKKNPDKAIEYEETTPFFLVVDLSFHPKVYGSGHKTTALTKSSREQPLHSLNDEATKI